MDPLIEAEDVRCVFSRPLNAVDQIRALAGRPMAADVVAVDGISLQVHAGARLGIVGASGGGKSTLGRLLAGVIDPDSGVVRWSGRDLSQMTRAERHRLRRTHVQLLTQNQYGALNPRMRAREVVEESLRAHQPDLDAEARRSEALALLQRSGVSACAERFVPALSGGERRRVTLASLIAAGPAVLILDEPVAGLDPILRNDAVRLFQDLLAARPGTALVLVSHELDVVQHLCDSVVVLQAGKIVERFESDQTPSHPHTQTLVKDHDAASLPADLRGKYTSEESVEDGVAVMEYISIIGTASLFFGAVIYALGGSMYRYLDMAFWWLSNPTF